MAHLQRFKHYVHPWMLGRDPRFPIPRTDDEWSHLFPNGKLPISDDWLVVNDDVTMPEISIDTTYPGPINDPDLLPDHREPYHSYEPLLTTVMEDDSDGDQDHEEGREDDNKSEAGYVYVAMNHSEEVLIALQHSTIDNVQSLPILSNGLEVSLLK